MGSLGKTRKAVASSNAAARQKAVASANAAAGEPSGSGLGFRIYGYSIRHLRNSDSRILLGKQLKSGSGWGAALGGPIRILIMKVLHEMSEGSFPRALEES